MNGLFRAPVLISLAIFAGVFLWSGINALITVAILSVLEVTFSFDNAVVNVQVLKKMDAVWRQRFLTWGIFVAVFGTRLILPALLVSASAFVSPFRAMQLAFFEPAQYTLLISGARYTIDAFGGAFLAMLSLRYFLDENKTVHWIPGIEKQISRFRHVEALEGGIVFAAIATATFFAIPEAKAAIFLSGTVGIILSIGIESLMQSLSSRAKGVAAGVGLFIYINILDSAFSLDGVVGAFAISASIPLIVLGLGIGAYFMRSLTLYLTHHKVLDSLAFMEHGAYWAIFGLAVSMFVSLIIEVPEAITGSIGLLFIAAAYITSLAVRRP